MGGDPAGGIGAGRIMHGYKIPARQQRATARRQQRPAQADFRMTRLGINRLRIGKGLDEFVEFNLQDALTGRRRGKQILSQEMLNK